MIFQDGTTETIEVHASAAGAIHWTCSPAVIVGGLGAPSAGTHGILAVAGAATISAAPGAGEHKQVALITAHNAGGGRNLVSIKKDVSGVEHVLYSDLLGPGDTIVYASGSHFATIRRATLDTVPVSVNNPGVSKASLATQIAGQYASLWRATAMPAQGAIPAAAAICTYLLLGAMPLSPRTGAQRRMLTGLYMACANAGAQVCVEDRLAHMGGLSGTVATAQTINVDVSLAGNNLPARIGSPDYSDVVWWMEWYTATGATIVTPSIACTHGDGTTGIARIFNSGTTALPATVAASRRYLVYSESGKPIRSLQNVTHPTTGTAGSYGFTATRKLGEFTAIVANRIEPVFIPLTQAMEIQDEACVSFASLCITTSTGVVVGSIQQTVV
jgi:hypothetical protein